MKNVFNFSVLLVLLSFSNVVGMEEDNGYPQKRKTPVDEFDSSEAPQEKKPKLEEESKTIDEKIELYSDRQNMRKVAELIKKKAADQSRWLFNNNPDVGSDDYNRNCKRRSAEKERVDDSGRRRRKF